MLKDFFSLLFPSVCAACGNTMTKNEYAICTLCSYSLPKTNFHLNSNNPVAKSLYGRGTVEAATAFLYFNKSGKVQNLMHQLKYKGNTAIGEEIGRQYGKILAQHNGFNTVDCIVPVPLHRKKHQQRGYNQSAYFAKGLAASMDKTVVSDTLCRKHYSDSQTNKTRMQRWENVKDIFELTPTANLCHQHILLVDDVLTTGATLEACINALQKEQNVKVSVATMAYAAQL